MLCLATAATAQTRNARDTATAYGARLNAKGEPAGLNQNRNNNRINSRLDTRLKLRIERYQPDSVIDPTGAFATQVNDNARIGTATTLQRPSQTGERLPLQTSPQSTLPPGTQPDDDTAQP
ncbi:hypothetical protein [Sphingomonas sp. PvP018]|jgi:hypothetical protein|uniref:hypothetical protein n=1 Tax=Sphingomonas sp. PvP018 TaxID=2817852 RepID=UPI001AE55993|nr:hypothetical protein [Sphingomonas sp. PvP018]MBP2513748.1 hypothetical protein [Sphingomonas sp. PvP018]